MNQDKAPLYEALQHFAQQQPVSFHVPGHKHGRLFIREPEFRAAALLDQTELTGLDDLHAPEGVILEAECLAADWFKAERTRFLVGGSTVGNLAMILGTVKEGDIVIVQRNCHKSILNGLELAGAKPVFVSPLYDHTLQRYTFPAFASYKQAIEDFPEAAALIVTYPDYYGKTFNLKELVNIAHQHGIPVLADEAHGVHFSLEEEYFPLSALEAGADLVVQSAHKMAPAFTMASYLHMQSSLIDTDAVERYLAMLQSSSPSYLLMASLDTARRFLATLQAEELAQLRKNTDMVREAFTKSKVWGVEPLTAADDWLKITLLAKQGYTGKQIAALFEEAGIYPELSTDKHVLFVSDLGTADKDMIAKINRIRAAAEDLTPISTIEKPIESQLFSEHTATLALSYAEMKRRKASFVSWDKAAGYVAAEAIIPYPPGIPILHKGEKITKAKVKMIQYWESIGVNFQNSRLTDGMLAYKRIAEPDKLV